MTKTGQQVALLTGATGFIGCQLATHLLEKGWSVHAIVRENSDLSRLQPFADKLSLHVHDGSMAKMLDIVADSRPDVVFHLAAWVGVEHRPEDLDSLLQTNILFGTQLIEAMHVSGVDKLVNAGTYWQFYDSTEYNPINLYAASKQAFQDILRYYQSLSLQAISLILYDTYGPHDPRSKILNLLQRAAESGEELAMSPGEQYLDLVYIDDVVAAFRIAAERLLQTEEAGGIFAVSSGAPLTLKELVTLFRQCSGSSLRVVFGRRPYREREIMRPSVAADTLPGWAPTVPLREGILRLLAAG